jgi:putative transposase
MDLWAYQNGVKIDFSRPGKPTDNAFIESFNGTFRAQYLDAHWFNDLNEARRLQLRANPDCVSCCGIRE